MRIDNLNQFIGVSGKAFRLCALILFINFIFASVPGSAQERVHMKTWKSIDWRRLIINNYAYPDTDHPISFIFGILTADLLQIKTKDNSPKEAHSSFMRVHLSQDNKMINLKLVMSWQENQFWIYPVILKQNVFSPVDKNQLFALYPGSSLPLDPARPHKNIAVTVALHDPDKHQDGFGKTFFFDQISEEQSKKNYLYPNWLTFSDVRHHMKTMHNDENKTRPRDCQVCKEIDRQLYEYNKFSQHVWQTSLSKYKAWREDETLEITSHMTVFFRVKIQAYQDM